MKERPIIFSGDEVRAILDGRKTMTRRVMKPQLVKGTYTVNGETTHPDVLPLPNGKVVCPGGTPEQGYKSLADYCPYGKVGDRLWVRETFTMHWTFDKKSPSNIEEGATVWYAADGKASTDLWFDEAKGRLRPSTHMPRWASRLTLEITGVRVERLQDISEEDARAEGFQPIIFDEFDIAEIMFNDPDCQAAEVLEILGPGQIPAKADFSLLWDRINGKRPKLPANKESKRYQRVKRWLGKHPDVSWALNPWVWVIEFKVLCN